MRFTFKPQTVTQQRVKGVLSLVTLQFVSQCAHVGWGFLLVAIPTLLIGPKSLWWFAGIVAVGAAVKEWGDIHGLEDDATSGGVAGSWEDFAFWLVGDALFVITCLVAISLGRMV